MKVLHVISGVDLRAGGPIVAMVGLAKAQQAAGIEVSALATWRKGQNRDAADELAAAGIHVTLIGPSSRGLEQHRNLGATMRAVVASVDVVHAHGVWESVQHEAAKAARRLATPYIITPHGMLTPWSLKQKWLKKAAYLALRGRRNLNGAAAIHFTSNAERDLVSRLGLKPKAIVEPLGVDLVEFETLPQKGAFRAKFPQIGDRKIIVFLGRLHPGKGMEYLIPAIASTAETPVSRESVLVAVGPDSQGFAATLQGLARQQGVGERVIFAGMLRGRERIEALVDADVFALPSEHENFGLVVIEALACGTPVVISDGVAIHDEIREAEVGSVVPVGDVNALTRELAKWLQSRPQDIAQRARKLVWERFDWSAVGRRWVQHYQAVVK